MPCMMHRMLTSTYDYVSIPVYRHAQQIERPNLKSCGCLSCALCNGDGISENVSDAAAASSSTEAHCLKLPGKWLDLTALLYAKKFRSHGYKKGAEAAFEKLKEEDLGTIEPTKSKK